MNFKHFRGRGLILDDASVSRGSFISRDSIAQGSAIVRDAIVRNESCADESCQIFEATLDRGYVGGTTIVAGRDVFIGEQSLVRCKSVGGRARITRSRLENLVEVFDDAIVDQVYLGDAVMVYGDARLFGPFVVGGFARIHEGTWSRAPLQLKLEHAQITECIEDRLLIDCRCRPRSWWLRFGPKFARRVGWTEDQIEETFAIVRDWPHLLPRTAFEAVAAKT